MSETSDTFWQWSHTHSEWIECWKITNRWHGDKYMPIDSRIPDTSFPSKPLRVSGSKPSWKPQEAQGTKIRVSMTIVCESSLYRTEIYPEAHYNELDSDDLEGAKVTEVRIVKVEGYDGTHRCSYCCEYSAINPTDTTPCRGCNAVSWEVWEKVTPDLGVIPDPRK